MKIKDSKTGDSMCWNKKLEQPDKYMLLLLLSHFSHVQLCATP